MADLIVNSTEENIIDSLNFKLPTTSKYVTDRRQVSFYPSGASDFSPNGVRTARVLLSGDGGWIDPSSLRIGFTIQNTHADQPLILASGPHCLIERVRIFCAGTLIEDLGPHRGRLHEMLMHRLAPQNHNVNAGIVNGYMTYNPTQFDPAQNMQAKRINAGYSAQTLTPICCGFLRCRKYLPVRYAGVMIEITFSDAETAVIQNIGQHADAGMDQAAVDALSRDCVI